jgi:sulfur carrier protein ThiS
MKIFIERQKKTVNMVFNGTVLSLLKKLNLNPEAVVVVANGTLVTEEDGLKDKDEIKILSVISGG